MGSWELILFIGIILTAIAIIVAIIIFSGSNSPNNPRPPVVDNSNDGNGSGEDDGGGNDNGQPGDNSGEQNGSNSDPKPPAPTDNGAACKTNSDCQSNNCSNMFCQSNNFITGNLGASCSNLSSGPACSSGTFCQITDINNGTGICAPATGKYTADCDNVNKRCNQPYVCTSSTCQFNVPTNACVNNYCPTGFTCVNNVCEALTNQFCLVNENCLSASCNNTWYGNRWIIDAGSANYLTWVNSLNPVATILTPAFIGQLEVSSDRTEAWMYIGTNTLDSNTYTDPNNSLRAVQYWNASLNRWSLAQSWKYSDFYTYPGGSPISGIIRGITLAPSNKCYIAMDVYLSTNSVSITGLAIFQIVPLVINQTVTFTLVPYNSATPRIGVQYNLDVYTSLNNFSGVAHISSTTYNNQDYMIILANTVQVSNTRSGYTIYTRDINDISNPAYKSTGIWLQNTDTLTSNVQPTYYLAPSSINPLLDYTLVNYGDSNNIVSLTYNGTISRTVSAPTINNTSNQFALYRHYQINAKTVLVMIYRSIGSPITPVLSNLAINFDVAQSDAVQSYPGYIISDSAALAANTDAIYVLNPSRCN